MGLILPQTIKVRINKRMCKYYKEKGYEFKKSGDFIEVNVLDLPKGSNAKVKVTCDICGKEAEMCYYNVNGNISNGALITCGSSSCKCKKSEGTCMKKYGVDNPSKVQEIKDKKKNTCQLHFKCDCSLQDEGVREKSIKTLQEKHGENIVNISQVKEIRDKIKNTWQKNYGENITSPLQAESVKDKIKVTLQKNYGEGIVNISQVKEIQDKIKQTMLNNYGVEYALQNRELLNKALDSFQFNGTGPCSRAQKYIHFLIGGTLNKRVCNSLVDICFEEEKIAIEYDGGGHFLGELMVNKDRSISKEALLKEKNREDSIVNKGYKVIRFIATKDRIPSDEVILNLVEGFKNSDFKVIRINFEEGTIDRDYEEKWYCNFGKLRKITKEDLERFENKKVINLK